MTFLCALFSSFSLLSLLLLTITNEYLPRPPFLFQTSMSTVITPDLTRHIARKSTVSRPTPSVFSKDTQLDRGAASLVLLPDNETEQMIVEDHQETIACLLEEILNHIGEAQLRTSESTEHCESALAIVSSDRSSSYHSTSQLDAEGTEMDGQQKSILLQESPLSLSRHLASNSSLSTVHSPSCHCECHQSTRTMTSTDAYLLFEQALQQTRLEQEQAFAASRLLQTLKQQHEELLSFYQKQVQTEKIDREQQTISVHRQDFQIQTDLITKPVPPVRERAATSALVSHVRSRWSLSPLRF